MSIGKDPEGFYSQIKDLCSWKDQMQTVFQDELQQDNVLSLNDRDEVSSKEIQTKKSEILSWNTKLLLPLGEQNPDNLYPPFEKQILDPPLVGQQP